MVYLGAYYSERQGLMGLFYALIFLTFDNPQVNIPTLLQIIIYYRSCQNSRDVLRILKLKSQLKIENSFQI